MSRGSLLSLPVAGCLALGGMVALAPAPAAAISTNTSVIHNEASPRRATHFWTTARIRRAKPLPLVHLSGEAAAVAAQPSPTAPPSYVPAAAPRVSRRAAIEGIDTGKQSSYPNRANGVIVGTYRINGTDELYRCSGSVINTAARNVVLTAGHCVIDPRTGTLATDLIFVPGYRLRSTRKLSEPFGEWGVVSFITTSRWQDTAGTKNPDEAGDIAMLVLNSRASDGAEIQKVTGALGIGFNQPRSEVYTQYGYPAASPYKGDKLYRLTRGYQFGDPGYSPSTMSIRSDFTGGASGGPWVVGKHPVALSVSDYDYASPAGYMFGPYFGSVARRLYRDAGGASAGSHSTGAIRGGVPATSNKFLILEIRPDPRRGIADVSTSIPEGGRMALTGRLVRHFSQRLPSGGTIQLPIVPRGDAVDELERRGVAKVSISLAYSPKGGHTRVKRRGVVLVWQH